MLKTLIGLLVLGQTITSNMLTTTNVVQNNPPWDLRLYLEDRELPPKRGTGVVVKFRNDSNRSVILTPVMDVRRIQLNGSTLDRSATPSTTKSSNDRNANWSRSLTLILPPRNEEFRVILFLKGQHTNLDRPLITVSSERLDPVTIQPGSTYFLFQSLPYDAFDGGEYSIQAVLQCDSEEMMTSTSKILTVRSNQ